MSTEGRKEEHRGESMNTVEVGALVMAITEENRSFTTPPLMQMHDVQTVTKKLGCKAAALKKTVALKKRWAL